VGGRETERKEGREKRNQDGERGEKDTHIPSIYSSMAELKPATTHTYTFTHSQTHEHAHIDDLF